MTLESLTKKNEGVEALRREIAKQVNIYMGDHIREAIDSGLTPPDGSSFITKILHITKQIVIYELIEEGHKGLVTSLSKTKIWRELDG